MVPPLPRRGQRAACLSAPLPSTRSRVQGCHYRWKPPRPAPRAKKRQRRRTRETRGKERETVRTRGEGGGC
eukprot:11005-Pyramimonas_sp.AAC.1